MKVEFFILLLAIFTGSVAGLGPEKTEVEEARGKAKYALLIHFFYVVATKLFVLKIVYGAIFYALIVKGWHFVSWFIHYLKETKSYDHHEYIEYDHEPSYHHNNGHEQHHYHGHDHYGHGYGSDSYGPYAYEKHGQDDYKNTYDADGSYSVKS